MATIFAEIDLAKARQECVDVVLQQVRILSRRAVEPVARAAWAELEHGIVAMQAEWRERGLLSDAQPSQQEAA